MKEENNSERQEECIHVLSEVDAVKHLQSNDAVGLSVPEAQRRLQLYGPNLLPAQRTKTFLERLWEQVNSVIVYILIVGAALSFGFNHLADGIVIVAVTIINITVGMFMEGKAENTTQKLKSLMSSTATVLRDEEKIQIEASNLTIGDIFFLQPGDVVPADGRVISAYDLHVLEAPLTGESHAVNKTSTALPRADVPLAERICMVYSGTQVIKGSATCITVNIGKDCEIGKISGLLTEVEEVKTPLVLQLERFAVYLSFAIIIIACIALGVASARDYSIASAFSVAIGIAIAAIPEGLPSCVTIIFSIGVRIMALKGAIVKSLPAVETLGSVSVICSDKTGTLTQNKMTLKRVCTLEGLFNLTDNGQVTDLTATFRSTESTKSQVARSGNVMPYLMPGIFCNDSTILLEGGIKVRALSDAEEDANMAGGNNTISMEDIALRDDLQSSVVLTLKPTFEVQGDPTEACILHAASLMSSAVRLKRWRRRFERVGEIPFDSAVKYMATMHVLPAGMVKETLGKLLSAEAEASLQNLNSKATVIFVKGAPERVLAFTNQTSESLKKWHAYNADLGAEGMRVLGLAFKIVPADTELTKEMASPTGFTMTSLAGIIDPPRPEAIVAVRNAQAAGITVKMITGDHPVTALAIGKVLGLKVYNDRGAVTGAELDQALEKEQLDEFDRLVIKNDVFARTTPEHKLRILQSLQRQGKVCSMTGDGVNDAPALKAANIGVAMGITGTEVAKDAANMIITDDNFATIVDAIRVGRCTYHNLVKTLAFVLPTNGGQAFSIILALLIGVDVPITALQILWVNMVISISLGLVLAFEPPHAEIMQHLPRKPGKAIFGRFLSWRVVFVSTVFVCIVLGNFQWEKQRISSVDELRTISCNVLAALQMSYVFNCRSLRSNTGPYELFTGNNYIYVGLLAAAVFQALFTYAPPFQYVFATKPLDALAWGKVVLWAVVIFVVVSIEKSLAYWGKKLISRGRRRGHTSTSAKEGMELLESGVTLSDGKEQAVEGVSYQVVEEGEGGEEQEEVEDFPFEEL